MQKEGGGSGGEKAPLIGQRELSPTQNESHLYCVQYIVHDMVYMLKHVCCMV